MVLDKLAVYWYSRRSHLPDANVWQYYLLRLYTRSATLMVRTLWSFVELLHVWHLNQLVIRLAWQAGDLFLPQEQLLSDGHSMMR